MNLKKQLKNFTFVFIAAVMVIAGLMPAFADADIKLYIDGKSINEGAKPVTVNGVTLLPLRLVSERLGGVVNWDDKAGKATINTAAFEIVFSLNEKKYMHNGATKQLEVPAQMIEGVVMIPIRAFGEAINARVGYDSKNRIAKVDYFMAMAGNLKITGSTTVQPIAQAAADRLMKSNPYVNITVAGGGSGAGVKDTIAGTNNIGMSSRDLTDAELQKINAVPIADDGIAIIVNPANPVKNLTKEQVKKIFLGEIKNWSEVGGNNAPILVQTRETGSGTRASFEEMALEKKSVVGTATPAPSSALILQAVAKSPNAIGYDSVGFVDKTVHIVSIDGVTPTAQTVNKKQYLLGRSLYMLYNGKPKGPTAVFIDYIRTMEVQREIIVKEGFLSLY